MAEIIQLSHLKEGFVPSKACLEQIAATRKSTFPIKLGNINYYGWYYTSGLSRDWFMFLMAFIAEFLILITLFFFAFKNGSISEREIIVLICTVLFIPIDFIALKIISKDFFYVNKNKQLIEILSGTGQDQIEREKANYYIVSHKNNYWKKASFLFLSFFLKVVGIYLTAGLPALPQIFLIIVAIIILFIHYNYSPFYFTYYDAKKKYDGEYKNSKHKFSLREENEVVITESVDTKYGNFVDAECIKPNHSFNFTIFDLKFSDNQARIKFYNNNILLDDTLITAVSPQNSDINKDIVAKMLIKHQTNL